MPHTLRSLSLALALVAILAIDASALTWTCSTVAQKGGADPSGGVFKSRFNDPAINSSGDVTFHARVGNGGRRLFLYPEGAVAVVIATQGDATPGGDDFKKFGSPSINDAGDVGFFADLDSGDGAFVREAGGTIVQAAGTGDASPTAGTFDRIEAVSRVNAAGDLAFFARVTGGDDGIFFFDKSAGTVATVAATGDATGEGREFCDFIKGRTVDLSDAGHATFQAKTAVACPTDSTTGFWLQTHGAFENVANVGDGASIAGTSYNKMYGTPLANASDKVLFRAKVRPADTCNNLEGDLCTMDSDCDDTCVGGTNVGEACTMLTDCPDQTGGTVCKEGFCAGGTNSGEVCTLLTDCPDQTGGTACDPGICDGDRCLGGADIGKPCGADSDCGGNECGIPGISVRALFLYDPSGPTTSTVAAERDTAPNTAGGILKTLSPPGGLSNDDRAAFRSRVRQSSARHGTFVFGAVDEDIVLATDAVPTDAFGPGSLYRKIVQQTGFSRTGTWFTYSARVKDFSPSPSNAGLFRCEGS